MDSRNKGARASECNWSDRSRQKHKRKRKRRCLALISLPNIAVDGCHHFLSDTWQVAYLGPSSSLSWATKTTETTNYLQGLPRPVSPQSCYHLSPCDTATVKFEGPWFTTQLTISVTIGVTSFLLFSYCRTRWPLLFAPRTKLKGRSSLIVTLHSLIRFMLGFSPHEAHAHQAFFGWIMPTIRTSEFTVLQIVGLDAAVVSNLLRFNKMRLNLDW